MLRDAALLRAFVPSIRHDVLKRKSRLVLRLQTVELTLAPNLPMQLKCNFTAWPHDSGYKALAFVRDTQGFWIQSVSLCSLVERGFRAACGHPNVGDFQLLLLDVTTKAQCEFHRAE